VDGVPHLPCLGGSAFGSRRALGAIAASATATATTADTFATLLIAAVRGDRCAFLERRDGGVRLLGGRRAATIACLLGTLAPLAALLTALASLATLFGTLAPLAALLTALASLRTRLARRPVAPGLLPALLVARTALVAATFLAVLVLTALTAFATLLRRLARSLALALRGPALAIATLFATTLVVASAFAAPLVAALLPAAFASLLTLPLPASAAVASFPALSSFAVAARALLAGFARRRGRRGGRFGVCRLAAEPSHHPVEPGAGRRGCAAMRRRGCRLRLGRRGGLLRHGSRLRRRDALDHRLLPDFLRLFLLRLRDVLLLGAFDQVERQRERLGLV
jgi:hypothetical protein